MRHTILWTGLLAAFFCTSCGPKSVATDAQIGLRKDKVLWRSHYVGGSRLEGNADAAPWVKLSATPASTQLREQTLHKLANAPFRALQAKLPDGAKDNAGALQPLLADLLRAESFIEWRGTSNRTDQFALAIKLPEDRAKAWTTSLGAVLKSWTGIAPVPFEQGGVSGWQLRKHDTPNLLGVARTGPWVVVGVGQDALGLFNEFIARLKTGATPFPVDVAAWGEVWADWSQVEPHLPFALPLHPPQTHLTIFGKDNNLRIKGGLEFEQSLNWHPQPWRIPTKLIWDPLISFTAARGIAPVIQQNDFLRALKLQPVPDEIYVWALDGVPFTTYAASPTANATNQLRRLAPNLMARCNPVLEQYRLGSLQMNTNRDAIGWRGLPLVLPFLRATKDDKSEFLIAGLFPSIPRTNPPPRELLAQIEGRKDLAYYDWEVTEPRLKQWRVTGQLFQILTRQPQLKTNMAAVQWLNSVSKDLGNTVTEITVSGDRQMTLTRKAPMGLTAIEFVDLAVWLESTNFPFSPYVAPALPPGAQPARTKP